MKRKGISEIVAVVLMIAVAISIGIFVSIYATDFIAERTGDEDVSCALDSAYIIESASFNTTGDNSLQVKITNKGTTSLHSFGFVIENITRIIRFNHTNPLITSQVSSADPIGREESAIVRLDLSNESAGHGQLGKTLTVVKITNNVCAAVSAEKKSITQA